MSDRASVVVVGVDGSAASIDALVRGCQLARAVDGTVELVTAWHEGTDGGPDPETLRYRAGHHWAVRVQTDAFARATRFMPQPPPATGVVVEGDPAEALALVGRGADYLVLGRRADDALVRAADSTRERCMILVDCPVLVVPEEAGQAAGTTTTGHSTSRRSSSSSPR